MKQFLLNMVKADNPTSSKRVAALVTLASTIVLAFIATFKNHWICPEFMYDGLLMVVAGLFGFNMAENIFKKVPVVTAPVDTTALDGGEAPAVPVDAPPVDAPPVQGTAVVDNPDA